MIILIFFLFKLAAGNRRKAGFLNLGGSNSFVVELKKNPFYDLFFTFHNWRLGLLARDLDYKIERLGFVISARSR